MPGPYSYRRSAPRYPVSGAVAVAQLVEPRVVVPVVAGSSPVRHLSFAFTMALVSYGRAVQVTRILALVLAGIYALAALGGLLAEFDSTRDTVLWVGFLGGGALLILIGTYFGAVVSPWLSAALVSIGAALGGVPLFWSILIPLAAAVLIAMSFAVARRPAPSA